MCFSALREKMMISSEYTKAICHLKSDEKTSMVHWKILGAFIGLNGMLENWYNPWAEVNEVLFPCASSIPTCQYMRLASKVEKNDDASPSELMHLTILRMGKSHVLSLHLIFNNPQKSEWSIFCVRKYNCRSQFRSSWFNYFLFNIFSNFGFLKFLYFWSCCYSTVLGFDFLAIILSKFWLQWLIPSGHSQMALNSPIISENV